MTPKFTVITITFLMIMSGFIGVAMRVEDSEVASIQAAPSYPYTNLINLWVRVNGTDIGDPYPYAGQLPSLGMNYFGTKTLSPNLADYSYANLTNSAFWASDSTMYPLMGGPGKEFNEINLRELADAAKTNTRIKGVIWDDFVVGWQDHTNMSRYYEVAHHEDGNLSQGALKLILVCYTKNYYLRSPYNWSVIHDDYDGISFWYWPHDTYSLETDFAGYLDSFMDMRELTGEDKEYWLGAYLHYYYEGSYPNTLPYGQWGEMLRLIDNGLADMIHLLENFWILNEPDTCLLVQDYLHEEYTPAFHSTLSLSGTPTVTTTSSAGSTIDAVTDLFAETGYGYRFISRHYQNVTVTGSSYTSPKIQTYFSGELVDTVNIYGSTFSFIALPNEQYRIFDRTYAYLNYTTDQHITTPTTWSNKIVNIAGHVAINSSLTIDNSILRFANNHYINYAYNGTAPIYGIDLDTNGHLHMTDSMIEPELRQFGYYIDLRNETNTGHKNITIDRCNIVHWAGLFKPCAYTYINDTVFYMSSLDGGTWSGFWIEGTVFYECFLSDNTFIYADGNSFINYVMPGGLANPGLSIFLFDGNTMVGGRYPVYVDMSYSAATTVVTLWNCSISPLSDAPASLYAPIDVESGSGTQSVNVYVRFRVFNDGDATGFTLRNSDGEIITSATLAVGAFVNCPYRVLAWTNVGGYDWINDYPTTLTLTTPLEMGTTGTAVDTSDNYANRANLSFGNPPEMVIVADAITISWGMDNVTLDIDIFYSPAVSRLIYLTLNMLALGVMIVVVGSAIAPLKDPKNRNPQKVTQTLIHTAIYIVIGLVLITMVNNIFIGG